MFPTKKHDIFGSLSTSIIYIKKLIRPPQKIMCANNKMGCLFSRDDSSSILVEECRNEALLKFNKRVSSYSYPHHGPYQDYIHLCRAQYELDCMPECSRQGISYEGDYNRLDY
jgi:hypothetical protein